MKRVEAILSQQNEQREKPQRPLDEYIRALGDIHVGKSDRIDLVSVVRDFTRTKSEVYSSLVKQLSVQGGIVFPDDQIYIDLKEFMAELTDGKDVMQEFQKMNSVLNQETKRRDIVTDQATFVDHSHPYFDTIMWEIPTVHPRIVFGLSMDADETGVLAHSYYIGIPYKERVGFQAFKRSVSRTIAQFLPQRLPVQL